MRRIKIIADSAADLLRMDGGIFSSVPMKIHSDQRAFVDDVALDVNDMRRYLSGYKGKSRTSCPNVADWVEAFDNADEVFCVTITSNLSGSYNTACMAKQMYEEANPGRHVCVIDTLSAGPEMKLVVEKLAAMIEEDTSFEDMCYRIKNYLDDTGLVFMLKSMTNLANNGRVSPIVAKIAGLVGIHVVGKASERGDLEPLKKCRGEKNALQSIVAHIQKDSLRIGKVRIAHCDNLPAAEVLTNMICAIAPTADVEVYACRGLCSFYAEQGGLLIGYERVASEGK